MKRIRIGKDISLRWEITTDGVAIPLEGRDLTVELKSPIGKVSNMPFRVDGNVLIMTYYGYEQTSYGEYSLTLWENIGKPGQNVVDAIRAFKLVRTSQEEDDFIGGDLQIECVDLGTANLDILLGSATPGDSPDLSDLKRKVDANTTRISAAESKVEENAANIKVAAADASEALTAAQEAQTAASSASENATQAQELANVAKTIAEQIQGKANDALTKATEATGKADNAEKAAKGAQTTVTTLEEVLRAAILELRMSIPRVKAFIVETGSESGYYMVDNKKVEIPANTRRSVNFTNNFSISEIWKDNPGIIGIDTTFTNTYSLTNMMAMFFGCSSLTSIDVSSFDTSRATRIDYMFYNCTSLTSIDLSNFDTSSVTYMSQMFFNCSSLTSIDLSNFDTSSVTRMDYIFFGCTSLTSIDLSNFDTSSVTSILQIFGSLPSLTSLLLGPNFFKTSEVTEIMFSDCEKWTNDTVITSLVTNSYDRASAGLNTLTLKLHSNTKAALTDEQKVIITNKGYTIA